MKQFDLKEYLANPSRKVVTRAGNSVRILCTNRRDSNYPIIALIENRPGGEEEAHSYTKDGRLCHISNIFDLVFAPEKHIGWINIFNAGDENVGKIIFKAKEKAEEIGKFSPNYVATVRIEWEE